MSRPTREQVDEALREHDAGDCEASSCCVLAAEVRALRAENAKLSADLTHAETMLAVAEKGLDEAAMTQLRLSQELADAELQRRLDIVHQGKLERVFARVQTLPDKWRDIVQRVMHPNAYAVHEAVIECAQDLEQALRGEE